MNERIKEIIAFLMDLGSSESKDPAVLRSELEGMGYSQDEIRQALDVLDLEPLPGDDELNSQLYNRIRILGESEKLILSTPAQGYLIRLHRMGWLSEALLSLIIENAALEFSPPVSIVEIKEIVSRYVSGLPEDVSSDTAHHGGQVH